MFSIFLNCNTDQVIAFNDSIFKKDLDVLFSHHTYEIPCEIGLFDFVFDEDFSNYDLLIQMARTNIHKIMLSSIDNQNTFQSLRESVTKLLLILRCNYQELK